MKKSVQTVCMLLAALYGVCSFGSDELDPNDGPIERSAELSGMSTPSPIGGPLQSAQHTGEPTEDQENAPLDTAPSAGHLLGGEEQTKNDADPRSLSTPVVNDAPLGSPATQALQPDPDGPVTDMPAVTPASPPKDSHSVTGSNALKKPEKTPEPQRVKPLVLLNSEVSSGTSARLGWRPSNSFNSITAPTTVLVVNGVKPGPTLCLTAAIHGDELNGIEIVRQVLFDIDPKSLSGAVIGVPIVNLDGFRRASRYLTDRRDLNRFFPGNPEGSSASRLAHSFFINIVQHCDLLIDLHTGSFRRTNLPQLRADLTYTQVTELADKMGNILVVQSKGAAGSLRRAAVEAGIPAVTLEAGAAHEFSRTAVQAGVKSVESALDGLKMLKLRRFWEQTPQPIYFESTWVRASSSGILFSNVALGQHVEKGEVLGIITDPITNVQSEIKAPMDGHVIGKALNQIMFPGFAAYHLGFKTEPHPELVLKPFREAVKPSSELTVDLPNESSAFSDSASPEGDFIDDERDMVEADELEEEVPDNDYAN